MKKLMYIYDLYVKLFEAFLGKAGKPVLDVFLVGDALTIVGFAAAIVYGIYDEKQELKRAKEMGRRARH